MPDATGLNSLLRQTGGSIGLAVFATLMSRWATKAYGSMIANVNPARPEVQQRIKAIASMFQSRGMTPNGAQRAAIGMIMAEAHRQAMVLSFERLFYLAGILFLFVLPLVFFLRMPQNAEKIEVHVEM